MNKTSFLLFLILVWINDPMNEVAKETIEIALKNPPDGVNVANQEWIESDSMDKNELMEIFCTKYDAMIDKQSPPDLGKIYAPKNITTTSQLMAMIAWPEKSSSKSNNIEPKVHIVAT